MQEFASVSASSYDPASLVAKLNEKAADGWSVVSIVPTGGDVTAFLSRESGAAAPAAAVAPASVTPVEPVTAVMPAVEPVTEPTPEPVVVTPEPVVVAPEPTPEPEPVVIAPAAQPSYTPTPTVPSGWYADPSGRFELRYWDGTGWTEHVSRAGQQFTDPPVA